MQMSFGVKFIMLGKIRGTINLLKKSNVSNELVVNGKTVLSLLKELQHLVRHSESSCLNESTILLPYLHILGSKTISGPYVRNSVEALQAFLSGSVLAGLPHQRISEALRTIVLAIINCKFIHTDITGDELVQLQMVETLRSILTCSVSYYLSDQTQWSIVEFCCHTLAKTGGPTGTVLLYQAAERVILEAMTLILAMSERPVVVVDGYSFSNGNPCLCRTMEYVVRVLTEAVSGGGHTKADAQAGTGQRSGTPPVHHRNLSHSSGQTLPLHELSCDRTTLHVLFVLKLVKFLLTAGENAHLVQQLLVRSKEFARLIGDDLGFSLLQLSSGSALNSSAAIGSAGTPGRPTSSSAQLNQQLLSAQGSPVVLAAVLEVLEALLHTVGPCLRTLVESFVRQVYLRALMQTYSLFLDQLQFLGEGMELVSPFVRIPHRAFIDGQITSAAEVGNFRLDEIEIILQSLTDVLSDPSTLPTWFASFDCDPTSADLVQPMIEYICRCTCLSWTYSSEFSSGYFKEAGTSVTQLFKHVCTTLHLRSDKGFDVSASIPRSANIDTADITTSQTESERLQSVASLTKATRGAKYILSKAAALFVEKPEKGLRYLQDRGSLPTPLTPESVAAFLRLAPDLPKQTSGAYLGELGKDDASYVGSSKEFHRLVLLRYVESFEFSNQSVLDCMRIFLSAFRLPGEAQQIDRILVAFSEHCHAQCMEGRSGLLENAEVTYVFTFSIIMLNTDRHNPNVRADRKMTLEQFVRNNTNYGKDANQTIPLPRDFLSSIFTSIDSFPIRTETKEVASIVTSEVWKDYQMQAMVDPNRSFLISTQRNEILYRGLIDAKGDVQGDRDVLNSLLREMAPEEAPHCIVTSASIVRRLLTAKQRSACVVDPLLLSTEVAGQYGLFDVDLLECVWLDLLRACLCVHVHHSAVMQRVLAIELNQDPTQASDAGFDREHFVLKHSQLRRLVGTSNAVLSDFLNVSNNHKLGFVMDCANLALLMCTGMVKGKIMEQFNALLSWDSSATSPGHAEGMRALDPGTVVADITMVDPTMLMYQLRHFESTRLAVSTLLGVIQNNQAAITHWVLVWYFLGGLRDCAILPTEMVVDADEDLLPPNIREEFESLLISEDKRTFELNKPTPPKKVVRQPSSILSLQGLGEVFFGGSSHGEEDDEPGDSPGGSPSSELGAYNAEIVEYKHIFKLNAISARWDSGYDSSVTPVKSSSAETDRGLRASPAPGHIQRHRDGHLTAPRHSRTIPAFSIVDGGATVEDLRALVAGCGVSQLLSDSRFLSEGNLCAMVKSLVSVAESKDDIHVSSEALDVDSLSEPDSTKVEEPSPKQARVRDEFLAKCCTALKGHNSFSMATVAWLEMVLVEISLRNRDRFQALWPALKHHYLRTLCASQVELSYVTERRVLGILKICTRMMSRDHFSGAVLELLGRMFARAGSSVSGLSAKSYSPIGAKGVGSTVTTDDEGGYTLSKPHFPPMPSQLLAQLSNQVAAAMWKVLTLNVDILPLLPLEQWQTLFSIIAISASSGGFASIKSFESMAWLLHEPRLVAKVPVFCIIGVRPLLRNPQAPLFVSVGAVHLLTHLHGRLEVLIKEEKEDYVDCEYDESSHDGDTPVLWESCWTPILKALGDGIADTRAPVREACAEALCQAILDRHSYAVPAGVLVDILGSIIAPMIGQLRDHLVEELNRSLPADLEHLLTSKEAAALTQQQWVSVDADSAGENTRLSTQGTEQFHATENHLTPLRPQGVDTRGGGTVSVLMECLSALCRSFLQHLRKLAAYPSFDKLWLCLLSVLGHFLDSNVHGSAELAQLSSAWEHLGEGSKLLVQDLFSMIDASRDHLRRMLSAMLTESVFTTRPGLLSVTRDTMKHFDDCEEIMSEMENL